MENPEVGARAAATKLLRAAHKHVKSERPCAASEPPLRSHITLAVNARGLSWALARSWQLPQEMLHNWYITLNSEKLNLDVIAVGRGDQLADHKVRGKIIHVLPKVLRDWSNNQFRAFQSSCTATGLQGCHSWDLS